MTYVNRPYVKKKLVDIEWEGVLLDNDHDPSLAHPPTKRTTH